MGNLRTFQCKLKTDSKVGLDLCRRNSNNFVIQRQLGEDSIGTLFANSVLGNSIVAVIAGLVAELVASRFGFV